MYDNQSKRDRFVTGGLETASGPRVVMMAFDRIDRDLAGALDAIDAKDIERAHVSLCHAQDIITELLMMLDIEVWEHAPALASIYQFSLDLLTKANFRKSPVEIRQARELLSNLGSGFSEAAVTLQNRQHTTVVLPDQRFSLRA